MSTTDTPTQEMVTIVYKARKQGRHTGVLRTERVQFMSSDQPMYVDGEPLAGTIADIVPDGHSAFEDEDGVFLVPTSDIVSITFEVAS